MIFQVVFPFESTIYGDSFKEAVKNYVKHNYNVNMTNLIIKDQANHYETKLRYYTENNKNKVGIDFYLFPNNNNNNKSNSSNNITNPIIITSNNPQINPFNNLIINPINNPPINPFNNLIINPINNPPIIRSNQPLTLNPLNYNVPIRFTS
jgi:hypothetical protein